MKINKVLAILLVTVLLASLVACGGKGSAPEESEQSKTNGELSGKIVVWSWDVAAKSLQEAAENFKKIHPKVEIQVEDMGTDQIYDKMTTGLASGVGLPDVVSIEGERVANFVAKFPEGFVDLTNVVKKDDFLPVKISEVTVNGKIMAFPWDGAPCGLFYRKDFFDRAGIKPEEIKTWDDFIEAGKKMDKIGVKMLPLAVSRDDTVYRLILNQLGSFYFDQVGKPVLNSEPSVKAMTLVKKMVDAKITYDNVNWDGLVTATKSGKIATVPNAVWWAGTLQDECSEQSGNWRVMRLPVVEEGKNSAAVNGGSNLMIPEASKNKQAAIEFVKFALTDKDSLLAGFSKYGLYPSYIPIFSEPIFEEQVPYFGGQRIWKLFSEIGMEIPELSFTENFAEVHSMVVDAQARITIKGADVKTTLDELQQNVVNRFGK